MPHRDALRSIIAAPTSLAIALIFATSNYGQPLLTQPAAAPTTPLPAENAPQPIADKRAENAELLRVAQRRLESGDPTDSAAAQTVAVFQSLDAVLAQQEAVNEQIKALEKRKTALDSELKSAPVNDAKDKFSFVELDKLKDDMAAEQAHGNLVDDRLVAAKATLQAAHAAFEDCETKRRQAQEAAEKAEKSAAAGNAGELTVGAEQAIQSAKLAAETVVLRKAEIARENLAREVQRLAVRLSQERIARLSPLVVFTAADYEAQIASIKKNEESTNKSLQAAQLNLQVANVKLQQAEKERNAETGDRAILDEKVEAARAARDKLSEEIDSLTQRRQHLAKLRVAWNRRYTIASSDHSRPHQEVFDELKSWQKEARGILDQLAADMRMQIFRMRELRGTVTAIAKKSDDAKDGPAPLKSWLDAQKRSVEEAIRIHEAHLVTIENSRRVNEKLLDEIGRDVQIINPKNLALGAWHQAALVWQYPITVVDDKDITVGKIVTCLLIFSGGWMCARISSAVFANRILRRFRLSKDATAAVRSLVFYTLLAAVTLAALKTVNVPLTAFTILGGALAIGVGFGSQALINNFVGGLIMLAERPVRLGERITFGNLDGVVEDVGFRCTKLRTSNDHLVTIPNSKLVNESIENIARRRTIKRTMSVAIAPHTPHDKVFDAVRSIRDMLEEKEIRERIHPIVGFEEFPPRVHFSEVTATNLTIQIVYWYAPTDWWGYMEHAERVNFRILEEFERLGIELSSPSRTVLVVNESNRVLPSRVA